MKKVKYIQLSTGKVIAEQTIDEKDINKLLNELPENVMINIGGIDE